MPGMKCRRGLLAGMFLVVCTSTYAASEIEQSRGELLYTTHCIACHTTQVHWRNQRLATDWETLARQVRRWQDNAHLSWNEEDIVAVTRYLNGLYYHFPPSEEKAISLKGKEAR
jgi:mono/diheme cytochrome c family protein